MGWVMGGGAASPTRSQSKPGAEKDMKRPILLSGYSKEPTDGIFHTSLDWLGLYPPIMLSHTAENSYACHLVSVSLLLLPSLGPRELDT